MITSGGCNEPLRVESHPSLSWHPGFGSRGSSVSAVTVLSHVELVSSTFDRVHIVAGQVLRFYVGLHIEDDCRRGSVDPPLVRFHFHLRWGCINRHIHTHTHPSPSGLHIKASFCKTRKCLSQFMTVSVFYSLVHGTLSFWLLHQDRPVPMSATGFGFV